ncbi:hypothetical protein PLICRDRAFT_96669 [Plicaturopsis crispa FD-325 SS-3]|nr:hypothetical protein PLICRDRAFT_96669 [Plicaturopsis crispa FD-325 SS-3]
MLVEDDFPLCGQWGVDGLVQTVDALRRRRKQGGHMSGFVGTGGSGLLLHSSIIPIAANLLLTQAMSTNLLAPTATDIVLQQCIRGVNPLCPPSTLLIPSRLIMHHAGGELSTFEGRSYPQDRWACGWRHPMHGMKDVEVVFDERPY